jgi:hypothetical protein
LVKEEPVSATLSVDVRADDLALIVDTQRLHGNRALQPVQPDKFLAFLHEADVVAVCPCDEARNVALCR